MVESHLLRNATQVGKLGFSGELKHTGSPTVASGAHKSPCKKPVFHVSSLSSESNECCKRNNGSCTYASTSSTVSFAAAYMVVQFTSARLSVAHIIFEVAWLRRPDIKASYLNHGIIATIVTAAGVTIQTAVRSLSSGGQYLDEVSLTMTMCLRSSTYSSELRWMNPTQNIH